jgi:DNA-binding SARP family transcriptional activator
VSGTENNFPQSWSEGGSPAPAATGGGRVQLSLLGAFRLECDGRPVALHHGAQRLVAFLALLDQPVGRFYVAASLWTDGSESRCAGNLRTALWRLRKLAAPVLATCDGQIGLADGVLVDTRELQRCAAILEDPADSRCLDVDVRLLSSTLLRDWSDEWVVQERERLEQVSMQVLEALAHRLTAAGRHARAVEAAMAVVRLDPLRESARRALIQAHIAQGNVAEAVRTYRRYRELLLRELAIEPTPLCVALVEPWL